MALIRKKQEESTETMKRGGESLHLQTLANRVLLSGRMTEKSFVQNALGQYVFSVAKNATKTEVRQAVEAAYGVRVEKVRMSRLPGKKKGFGRNAGTTSVVKKAIVSVPKGTELQLFKGI
ncbi:MAG: 50S ribosomal protein L23 [Candidatus Moranbacteria bacterium]|nr:50S ribosomal protein L23 [Candidatus Moranbacteria bacterium]